MLKITRVYAQNQQTVGLFLYLLFFKKIMDPTTEPHLTDYLLKICGYSGIELEMTEVLPLRVL